MSAPEPGRAAYEAFMRSLTGRCPDVPVVLWERLDDLAREGYASGDTQADWDAAAQAAIEANAIDGILTVVRADEGGAVAIAFNRPLDQQTADDIRQRWAAHVPGVSLVIADNVADIAELTWDEDLRRERDEARADAKRLRELLNEASIAEPYEPGSVDIGEGTVWEDARPAPELAAAMAETRQLRRDLMDAHSETRSFLARMDALARELEASAARTAPSKKSDIEAATARRLRAITLTDPAIDPPAASDVQRAGLEG